MDEILFTTKKLKVFDTGANITGQVRIFNKIYTFHEDDIFMLEFGLKSTESGDINGRTSETVILKRGTSNLFISKMYSFLEQIQLKRDHYEQNNNKKERLHFENLCKLLFDLLLNTSSILDSYETLYDDYQTQLTKIPNVIMNDEHIKTSIYILNLDKRVKDLIINDCGGFLNKFMQIICLVYESELSNNKIQKIMKHDKRIDNALDVLVKSKCFKSESRLAKVMKNMHDTFFSKFVVVRNACEHPDSIKNVQMNNFFINAYDEYQFPIIFITTPHYNEQYELIPYLKYTCENLLNNIIQLLEIIISDYIV